MPGAAYGDDDARDIPEKELYPAESAFAGPARVADQCDPAETVILHAPVDAVMTYTWDARRGRNLHVAWPANIPELARHEPPPPRTDGLGPRGRDHSVRQNQDARRLHPGREARGGARRVP